MSHIKTFQYSVKENIRPIGELFFVENTCQNFEYSSISLVIFVLTFGLSDHSKGSHGMPGLYFKYDVSALKVIVKPDQEGFMHFLIRISSVIAGIIVISGTNYL